MKNLRGGLYALVLVSLICLFIPGTAFAQDPSPDPCCHLPPLITVADSGVIQTEIQPFQSEDNDLATDAQLTPTEMPVSDQLSLPVLAVAGKTTEMPVTKEESWTPSYKR
jgi:hypothetical protein